MLYFIRYNPNAIDDFRSRLHMKTSDEKLPALIQKLAERLYYVLAHSTAVTKYFTEILSGVTIMVVPISMTHSKCSLTALLNKILVVAHKDTEEVSVLFIFPCVISSQVLKNL